MSIKAVLLVCAQALLVQTISAQCMGPFGRGAAFATGFSGYGPASLSASNGPGLMVSSSSPLLPSGVSVLSENAYEGVLTAGGAIPFVGTVALEGTLATAGAGAIAYDCGDGAVGIIAEDLAAIGIADMAGPFAYGAGFGRIAEPLGIGYGVAEPLAYGAGFARIAEPLGNAYGLAEPLAYGAGFARIAEPLGNACGLADPLAYGAGFGRLAEPLGIGYGVAEPLAYRAGFGRIAEPFGYGYGIAEPLAYGAGFGYRGF